LLVAAADSTGDEQQLTHDARDLFVNGWLPDGRLAVTQYSPETGNDVWLMDAQSDAPAQPLLHSPFSESEPAFSSDGRWVAFVCDESGRNEVYVERFPLAGPRIQISRHGGEEPLWSRTGHELYFRQGPQMLAAQIGETAQLAPDEPRVLFTGHFHYNLYPTNTYDVAADGRFLMVEEPPAVQRSIQVVRFMRRVVRRKSDIP
jgi:dipeptidyl aminopeptidase/acylaminoacyl peptidase